jgi:hypothetical protein
MKLKPLPGFMIVKLESLYKNTGPIHIPERFRQAPHLIGTVMRINLRDIDRRTLGFEGGEVDAGKRILVSHLGGRFLANDTWLYPITLTRKDERGRKYRDSGILAVVDDSVELKPHTQDVPRCQFCGQVNGSNQNMIMFNDVCPRCGKNRNGEIPDSSVHCPDSLIEDFQETQIKALEVEQNRRRHMHEKLLPYEIKKKIISMATK